MQMAWDLSEITVVVEVEVTVTDSYSQESRLLQTEQKLHIISIIMKQCALKGKN